MSDWSDIDKAQWILENGTPDYCWIYERNGEQVYRRPSPANGTILPPWLSDNPREPIITYTADKETYQWVK